jgi:hypothetical protein
MTRHFRTLYLATLGRCKMPDTIGLASYLAMFKARWLYTSLRVRQPLTRSFFSEEAMAALCIALTMLVRP